MVSKARNIVLSKQRNEGFYLLDWISWHLAVGVNHFHITSNGCSDFSEEILNTLSNETGLVSPHHLDRNALQSRSIGEWSLDTMNDIIKTQTASFVVCLDLDEYLSFQNNKIISLNEIELGQSKTYHLPWLNCIPSDLLVTGAEPVFIRNSNGITKTNPKFPYAIGFSGKQLKYNEDNLKLANYHSFEAVDASSEQPIKSDIFIKHCVINTIDEFVLRCERGQATAQRKKAGEREALGESLAIREANNYKYAIDLFLMYASQGLTSNIQTNPVIAKRASEVKADLLSNPKIKSAQNKIDEYYNRKFKEIQKGYVSSVVKQLELTHIDKLNTKELKKFNAQFFKKNQKKPHDYYVLMTLSCLFEEDFEQARQYCASGLQNYASVKLLAMMRSPILRAPFITYP
ncbi:glycosyltransferase family 2 protein [Alphaproteobacteria bacterium]|nr:glycosyltransferase family 2 protein [Alphaproteobacteria bacterium]